LRHLKKPVEFYVAPNVERGYHTLHNPRQLLAVQERALDWWRFWLKDEVDRRPEKIQQYTEWSRLRALRDEDLKSLQSPRLRWSAEPGNVCDIRQC